MSSQFGQIPLRSERSGVRDLPPSCCVLEQDTLTPRKELNSKFGQTRPWTVLTAPRRYFCCGSLSPVFGVRVSLYVSSYYVSLVWVAEWPPFGKKLLTRLTICSVCVLTICNYCPALKKWGYTEFTLSAILSVILLFCPAFRHNSSMFNILIMDRQNETKFCIHIIIDKINIGFVHCCFSQNLQSYGP